VSAAGEDRFHDLQRAAVRFRDERDWAQFHHPKDLALGLQVEAAELAELFLWKTNEEARQALEEPAFRGRLAEEMADVQMFLLYLAEAAGLHLPDAVEAKLETNARKYPVEKARGTARKYTDL